MFRFIAPIALKIDLRVLGPVWSSQNPDQIQSRYVNNRPNIGLLIGLRLGLSRMFLIDCKSSIIRILTDTYTRTP